MLLEGMFLPLTTPFSTDGRVNLRKLEQNTARYSLTPAAGMVVLGPTGEATLLSDEETGQILKTALESAASTKIMIAGISRDSLRNTLELVEESKLTGYDAVLLHPPLTPRLSPQEQRTYLQMVADRSPLPLILAGDIPLSLTAELAFHSQIFGFAGAFDNPKSIDLLRTKTAAVQRSVKVTHVFTAVTGRMSSSQASSLVPAASLIGNGPTASPKAALKTRDKTVGFQLLTANTESLLDSLKAGAVGAIPPFAAAAPQATYEIMAAWKDGDAPLAEEKQQRLTEAIRLIEGKLGVAGLKYGCDLNGYFGGSPRLPLLPLTGEQRAEIERLMQGLRS